MMLPLDSPLFWLLAVTGVVLTGISKSGFAGGGGVLAVPLLALMIPVPQAAALVLPVLIVMDIKTVHYYWRSVDWTELAILLPAAVVGILVGGLAMGKVPDALLQWLLGGLCLLFASWSRLSGYLHAAAGRSWLWGSLAGFSSTLIHAGGPPLTVYLVHRQLPKLHWLAVASVFFALINLIKVLPYFWLGQWQPATLQTAAMLVPAALLGVWLGRRIQGRLDERRFLSICRWLLLLSGVALLAKPLLF